MAPKLTSSHVGQHCPRKVQHCSTWVQNGLKSVPGTAGATRGALLDGVGTVFGPFLKPSSACSRGSNLARQIALGPFVEHSGRGKSIHPRRWFRPCSEGPLCDGWERQSRRPDVQKAALLSSRSGTRAHAQIGPPPVSTSPQVGRTRPDFGRDCADTARVVGTRADFAHMSGNSAQIGQLGPESAKLAPKSTVFGPTSIGVCRVWLGLDHARFGPSTTFGRIQPIFGQLGTLTGCALTLLSTPTRQGLPDSARGTISERSWVELRSCSRIGLLYRNAVAGSWPM